jgi:hypothetical protein
VAARAWRTAARRERTLADIGEFHPLRLPRGTLARVSRFGFSPRAASVDSARPHFIFRNGEFGLCFEAESSLKSPVSLADSDACTHRAGCR